MPGNIQNRGHIVASPGSCSCQAHNCFAAQAVEDVNRQTGANVDPNADPGDMLQSNTRGLMAAMSTLPELTERKRTIDKHTALLGSIVKVNVPMRGWLAESCRALPLPPAFACISSPELALQLPAEAPGGQFA